MPSAVPNIIRFEPPKPIKKKALRRIRVELPPDPVTGARRQKSFYGHTLKECYQKRDAFLAAPVSPRSDMTFSDWVNVYRETYLSPDLAPNTVRETNYKLDRLAASFPSVRLRDLLPMDIQRFAHSVPSFAPSAVNQYRSLLSLVLRQAVANGLIDKDPSASVRWPASVHGTHRMLTSEEVRIITSHYVQLDFATPLGVSVSGGVFVMLMLWAGLRLGEALGLRWQDISADTIHVRAQWAKNAYGVHALGSTKTADSVRDVPILAPLRAALDAAPRWSEYICSNSNGTPLTVHEQHLFLEHLNALVGSRTTSPAPIRCHDLRHTFASLLYDADVDPKTAAALMGHKTIKVTMDIYTHLSEQRKSLSIGKLQSLAASYEAKRGDAPPETP